MDGRLPGLIRPKEPDKKISEEYSNVIQKDPYGIRPKEPDKSLSCPTYHVTSKSIYSLSKSTRSRIFEGGCLDTGAYRTVIGISQCEAYANKYKLHLAPFREQCNCVFGDDKCPSLGVVFIIIPTPSGVTQIKTHIVRPDVPFLIGLDVLDKHSWNILTVQNKLESVGDGWEMSCIRKYAHIYVTWDDYSDIFYSKASLFKLHHHFMHPSVGKLLKLLERASKNPIPAETKKALEDITRACHICQTYSSKPLTFQVRLPDDVIFNKEVRLDLMFLDGKAVLHVLDTGTNFSAARFLSSHSSEAIWNTFLYCWVNVYLGYPMEMLTDQGSAFANSKLWKQNCSDVEITLRHTGTESHNSLGAGERYHALLRRVYNKIGMQFQK